MSPTNVLFVFVVIRLNKVGDIPPNFLKSGFKPNKGCLVRFCCVFYSRGRSDLSGLLPSRLPRGEGKGVGLRARAHAAATPTSPPTDHAHLPSRWSRPPPLTLNRPTSPRPLTTPTSPQADPAHFSSRLSLLYPIGRSHLGFVIGSLTDPLMLFTERRGRPSYPSAWVTMETS
jgi:hypothetical protein